MIDEEVNDFGALWRCSVMGMRNSGVPERANEPVAVLELDIPQVPSDRCSVGRLRKTAGRGSSVKVELHFLHSPHCFPPGRPAPDHCLGSDPARGANLFAAQRRRRPVQLVRSGIGKSLGSRIEVSIRRVDHTRADSPGNHRGTIRPA